MTVLQQSDDKELLKAYEEHIADLEGQLDALKQQSHEEAIVASAVTERDDVDFPDEGRFSITDAERHEMEAAQVALSHARRATMHIPKENAELAFAQKTLIHAQQQINDMTATIEFLQKEKAQDGHTSKDSESSIKVLEVRVSPAGIPLFTSDSLLLNA